MKKLILTLILILYILGIILFSSMPSETSSLPKGTDKVIHFIEFFVLTIIFLKVLSFYKIENKLLIVFITSIIIAIAIELIQIPIPTREFSLWDIVADLLGILSALVIKWKS